MNSTLDHDRTPHSVLFGSSFVWIQSSESILLHLVQVSFFFSCHT